ncbi:MAG: transcription termination/antitermination protein NusG [Alphaproteobacteria bacterium]|jgi:transcriptional antiterminator NusG|nr:transcription termination/antitermination protein NusG [Alphaproteobacteria bacterium]
MGFRWYIIHAHSGFEKKVAASIEEKASKYNMGNKFKEIIVPMEEVIEVKKGKKVNTEKKIFPGYVLINMDLNDDSWHLVKSTPKVTGFLGDGTKPLPISQAEADRIIKQMEEGVEKPRSLVNFEVGEEVVVAEGPFATFTGVVEVVDEDKQRLKVSVSIFGRSTPVDLDFTQVEKS